MEKLYIGDTLILDTRSRVLSRVDVPYRVTLGVSACRCLEELIKAQGAILSQDALLHKGWKQLNLEVTASSLRVVINQIRKAFLSLRVEKQVVIVTVPRTGYRMLAAVETPAPAGPLVPEPVVPASVPDDTWTPEASFAPSQSVHSLLRVINPHWIRPRVLLFLPASLAVAALLAWVLSPWYWKHVAGITYEPYVRAELKILTGEASVFVAPRKYPSPAQVLNTLSLWKQYVPDVSKWQYLYVSDSPSDYLHSLFACTRPLEEKQNDCTSFVFKMP